MLRAAMALLRWLPYRFGLLLAAGIAWFLHRVVRFRALEARRRIRTVLGPDVPERQIRAIAWISWRNLCFNVVEMARFPDMERESIEQISPDFENKIKEIASIRNGNNGFILATIHMGNWELGGFAVHIYGFPLFVIARRQKNPLTDKQLLKIRNDAGIDIVMNDKRVLRNIIRKLKNGDILAILPDVRARSPALQIEFLGAHANIGRGMAMFARQTGLPILPVYGIRKGWTQHRWQFLEPVYPDQDLAKEEDWHRMTQMVMIEFGHAILKNPEQYFWYNKRWVLDPIE